MGGYRRTPPASSRPHTMDPPDIFEAVIYIRWSCRTPSGLAVGSVSVEIERRSSHELIYISLLTLCNRKKKTIFAACSRWREKKEKIKRFFSFFPTAAFYEEIFGCSLTAIFVKEYFWTLRFHWHRSSPPNMCTPCLVLLCYSMFSPLLRGAILNRTYGTHKNLNFDNF